ncbi:hypothetical protein L195_g032453 [Trifolium pratense]|uniref:Uncharacterized protein n=1 Tax=Trifolium pratense TaxID=57577 RepID=A0A2K3LDD8_TRIPR|nr:hypothetical protein L195_g032453 [Trifolium pratense]
MAHISRCNMSKAILLMVFLVVLLLATEVRAQDGEAAASPAPSPDVGAGFLVTYSGSFVCSSLLFSLVALFSH